MPIIDQSAMIVQDAMNKEVKTIAETSTVREAAERMREFRIGSLIVVKDSRLVGILTERDILDKVVAEALDSSTLKVKDIMTKEVVMISPDKDISTAAELMVEKRVKKLPVLQGKKLVGIITATDVCTAEPKIMEEIGALMLIPREKKRIAG